jgi:uncharacterized membrane protein YGL010W
MGEYMAPARNDWIDRYERSHRHPVNRVCHTIGIPMIVFSLLLALPAIAVPELRLPALGLFVTGWILQFIGHAVEGKPPEFFSDWRFLFVGFRWWLMKVTGRV